MFHRHVYMIISEVVTLGIYALSMVFLPEYFGAFGPTFATAPAPPTLYTHSHLLFFFATQIYRLSSPCGSGGKLRSSSR